MPQYDATIKRIEDGVKRFTIGAAVKDIKGRNAEKIKSPGEALVSAAEAAPAE